MEIKTGIFGKHPNGEEVNYFVLSNDNGVSVKIIELGARMAELWVPDKNGEKKDVIMGFSDVKDYIADDGESYQGAVVGRYANRIGHAEFTLKGQKYSLYKNSCGEDSLHGGKYGLSSKIWKGKPFNESGEIGVELSVVSPDGEEGYPGTLKVAVKYTLNNQNELSLRYTATTDKTTVINLTNHSYFNLNGYDSENTVMDNIFWLDSDRYTAVDDRLIPTGEIVKVEGSIFDFTTEREITNGFDHNFIFTDRGEGFYHRATVWDRESGREMKMYTDQPAVQIYTACMLNGDIDFKGGVKQQPLHAVCLETQHYPDSPNRPEFPTTILNPDEVYESTTKFVFSVR